MRKSILAVALVIAGAVIGAASVRVLAAIPDSSGDVHTCYKTNGGNLRVIDSSSQQCTNNEAALDWTALHRTANAISPTFGSIPPATPQTLLSVPQFGDILVSCDQQGNTTMRFHNTSSNTVYSQYASVAAGDYSDNMASGQWYSGSGAQTRTADVNAWVGAQGDPINLCYFQARAIY